MTILENKHFLLISSDLIFLFLFVTGPVKNKKKGKFRIWLNCCRVLSFLKLEEKESREWDFYSLVVCYFIHSHGIFLSVIDSKGKKEIVSQWWSTKDRIASLATYECWFCFSFLLLRPYNLVSLSFIYSYLPLSPALLLSLFPPPLTSQWSGINEILRQPVGSRYIYYLLMDVSTLFLGLKVIPIVYLR